MPLGPGDFLVTTFITDTDQSTFSDEVVGLTTTTNIAPGEVIRIWDADLSPTYFEYTVGAGGLLAGQSVRFVEDANAITIIGNPSGAGEAVTSANGTMSFSSSDPVFVTSFDGGSHQIIAGFSASTTPWDVDLLNPVYATENVSRTLLDAYSGPLTPAVTLNAFPDDNAMFTGDWVTGYGNSANWVISDVLNPGSHLNPELTPPLISYSAQDTAITCFAAGTQITLRDGNSATVETLRIGNSIASASGGETQVIWVGRQTISRLRHGRRMQPVRIAAGALGNGLPYRDLVVTGDHGMVIDGWVVNASALVNGGSIDWVPAAELLQSFVVYHIETKNHDVILANGAAAETFVDYVGRKAFDNYAEYEALYGAERIISELPLPRITSRRLLPKQIIERLDIVNGDRDGNVLLSA